NPHTFLAKCPYLATRCDLQYIIGDIRTFEHPSARCDFLMHGANEGAASSSLELVESIVAGTIRVCKFAEKAGVRKLLQISSGAVYGNQPSYMAAIGEDYVGKPDPTSAMFQYGNAKHTAEETCLELAR